MDRDYVTARRERLISHAAHLIGIDVGPDKSRTLRRSEIPGYLHRIGCPLLLSSPPTLLSLPVGMRGAVDNAAKSGIVEASAGMFLTPTAATYSTAVEYAAVVAAEFLRRKRTITWHSVEEVFAAAPRRVIDSDDDADHNDLFADLTQVFELVVVHGVMAFGHTDYEQRSLVKVFSERMTWALPTVVISAPSFNTGTASPLADYLLDNFVRYDDL